MVVVAVVSISKFSCGPTKMKLYSTPIHCVLDNALWLLMKLATNVTKHTFNMVRMRQISNVKKSAPS